MHDVEESSRKLVAIASKHDRISLVQFANFDHYLFVNLVLIVPNDEYLLRNARSKEKHFP